jgi:transposase
MVIDNNYKALTTPEFITLLNQKETLIAELQNKVNSLNHQVNIFQKALFGSKKETHQAVVNSDQAKLEFIERVDLDLPQDIEAQKTTYHRKAKNTKRTDYSKLELPADLERVETVIEPLDKTEDMVKIGEEVTELLAIVPQKFYVKKIIRPKYARPNNEGVTIAELPSRPLQGGKVDVSLLVMILLDKYVDHMPLYRQLKKYERLGVKLSDSTIGSWAAESIKLLEYLYEELKIRVKNSSYIQVDETPIKVLDKDKKGTAHRGYYWVYHDVENGLVLYEYDPSRGQTAPLNFLTNYTGYLQADGYGVYDALPSKQIKLLACMAHARRYFFDAQENDKARATWMLDKLQELYAIEQTARENKYTNNQRLELRQQKSVVILQQIKQWLNQNQLEVTPKSPIGRAISYTNVRWDKLCLFTNNGILEIDNNLVENAIRPIALGRKNYLFAGSHQAASRAGIIYSFITCCKKNNIDPYNWLQETLSKISDTKKSELYTLLPFKPKHVV